MKFRMVDRILSWQKKVHISGLKTVSFEEYNLKAPMGDIPHLPESLMMESMFQLGNWLIMLSSDFTQMGLLVRTQKVEFYDMLLPGQSLQLDVEVSSWREDGIVFDGRAQAGQKDIASGVGCLAAPVNLADYYDPDNMQVLFSEIFIPKNREAVS